MDQAKQVEFGGYEVGSPKGSTHLTSIALRRLIGRGFGK